MSETPTPQSVMEKLEFYFLGLTFTLLALAIQTFTSTSSLIADVVEVCGWVSLLISGILGLLKVIGIPSALHLSERQSYFKQFKNELLKEGTLLISPKDGSRVSIPEGKVATEKLLKGIEDAAKTLGKKHNRKHIAQWCFFLLGIIALLLARASGVIQRVIDSAT